MTELPSKQKVEIQRCSQSHFEKIFTPLKNDSESIYKKLEELEFREVPDTDHYYDESIEVVNGSDDELNVLYLENREPNRDIFELTLPDKEQKPRKLSEIIMATEWKFYQDNLFLKNNTYYKNRKNELVNLSGAEKLKVIPEVEAEVKTDAEADERGESISNFQDQSTEQIDICLVIDSSRSSLYYAYEMYRLLVANSFPVEFGGPKIKIVITDFEHANKVYTELESAQLNPSNNSNLKNFENDIFFSLFTKYKGIKNDIRRFLSDVLFRYEPTEIRMRKGQVPYNENEVEQDKYQPTNLVYFGDISKVSFKLVADNIHSQMSYNQEEFSFIEKQHDFNYFCSYYDYNLHEVISTLFPEKIPAESPKIISFNDSIRISYEHQVKPKDYEHQEIFCWAYLVYSKEYNQDEDTTTRNIIIDDILEAIPTRYLSPKAKELRLSKKETLSTFHKELNDDEMLALELNTGLIESAGYSTKDILNEPPVEFIVINDSDKLDSIIESDSNKEKNNLGMDIIRRGLQRGFNIHLKYYCKKDLPLEDLYSTFDAFIYSSFLNSKSQWKEDNRFIPECYHYNKKVFFGPKTKNFNLHPGLRFRIDAAKNHSHSLKESQIRVSEIEKNLYKSKIINNLLGFWGY